MCRPNNDSLVCHFFAGHESVEQCCNLITGLFEIAVYARQRRITKVAKCLVVFHADNSYCLRDVDISSSASLDHMLTTTIVTGQ